MDIAWIYGLVAVALYVPFAWASIHTPDAPADHVRVRHIESEHYVDSLSDTDEEI